MGEISKLGAVSLNCPDPHELALFYSALLEKEITFEGPNPPMMTADLAAALAQLVRAALVRRAECPEQVA